MEQYNFIENIKLLVDYFGYFPTFHDDVVTDIVFDLKKSSMEMQIMTEAKSKKTFITIIFNKIKKIEMEGFEPNLNIIFEMNFIRKEDDIETEIRPAVGMYAKIICENIAVKEIHPF